MLGDTGVAVHPEDERYRAPDRPASCSCRWRTGGSRSSPTRRSIPSFGTGAVKVTPAHDPLDFEIGRRHGLPSIDVMTPGGADQPGGARSGSRGSTATRPGDGSWRSSRQAGLLEKVEDAPPRRGPLLPLRHRGRAPALRPVVRADGAAGPARAGGVPRRDAALHSRAPGRRLRPAGWRTSATGASPASSGGATAFRSGTASAERCGRTSVSRTDLDACPGCGGPVRQDEDVLDTWFSSWLVPFSSLGWPEPDRRTSRRSTPATPWSPRPRSSSSGWRG